MHPLWGTNAGHFCILQMAEGNESVFASPAKRSRHQAAVETTLDFEAVLIDRSDLLSAQLARIVGSQSPPNHELQELILKVWERKQTLRLGGVVAALGSPDASSRSSGEPVAFKARAVVGFDMEWDVNRQGGSDCPVSVIQIGNASIALVVHLPSLAAAQNAGQAKHADDYTAAVPTGPQGSGPWAVPSALRQLLEDESVIKVGVNCMGDALKLFRDNGICTRGLLDVARLWQWCHDELSAEGCPRALGLKALVEQALGVSIPKTSTLRCAKWSSRAMITPERLRYAALDAVLPVRSLALLWPKLPALRPGPALTAALCCLEQPYYARQRPVSSEAVAAGPAEPATASAAASESTRPTAWMWDGAQERVALPPPAGRECSEDSGAAGEVPAAAYAHDASWRLARNCRSSPHGAPIATAQLAALDWQSRAHALWHWRRVPATRLASALRRAPDAVFTALLRRISHRDSLHIPSHSHRPVILHRTASAAAELRSSDAPAASKRARGASSDDAALPIAAAVENGLPYVWGRFGVPASCEAGVVRRLRCLEAVSGLCGATLCPATATRHTLPMAEQAPASTGAKPTVAYSAVHGPLALGDGGATKAARVGTWCIQAAIDARGCITRHPALAQLEWPSGVSGWPEAITSLTLPLPVGTAAVDRAFEEVGQATDGPAATVNKHHFWCVLAHLGRMGLRGVVMPQGMPRTSP